MKIINAVRIRVWLPVCMLIFLLSLMSSIVWLNYSEQSHNLIQQSQLSFVNAMSGLARDIERHVQRGENLEVERLFKLRNIDTHFELLLGLDDQLVIQFSSKSKFIGHDIKALPRPLSAATLSEVQKVHKPTVHYDAQSERLIGYFPFARTPKNDELRPFVVGVIYGEYTLQQDFYRIDQQIVKKSLVFLFFICLMLGFLAFFIHIYVLKPISQLISATQLIGLNTDVTKLEIHGDGEFASLANNFNSMAKLLHLQVRDLRQAKTNSHEKQLLLESFLNAIPDLFFVVKQDSTITQFHTANPEALYTSPTHFLGKKMTEVLPLTVANLLERALKECIKKQTLSEIQYELDIMGQTRHFEARLSPIKAYESVAVVVRDITEHKHQEELIFKHAFYDSLTGLPNRYLVLERLSQMIIESKRTRGQIAVMFIDLDDFKKVNDSTGHETGDKLLIDAAKRLQGALREQDTVGRLGGDEFIILLKSIRDQSNVVPIANNLVKLFQSPFCIDQKEFSVSLSLGIAMYPNDADSPQELLSKADSAMYNSKRQGRNTFSFYTEKMSEILARRLQLESMMQSALERNEFSVFFQPQFDLKTKKLLGAEALLRWNSNRLGPISPAEFIPVAEQNGYIVEMGKFVLREALANAQTWQQDLPYPLRIAINLSPRQFRDVRLLHDLQKFMANNVDPKVQIELEITEGLLLSGDDSVKSTLYQLHDLGFMLAMDDFGTGYSSLSYLRQYPFDVLKIDKSFVQDMGHDSGIQLVNTIISMAHGLGLKVVAEGIETEEQMELLTKLGCDVGQGFYLGKPMPSSVFDELITHFRSLSVGS
ncbi:EAL domain-containing protein [Pseudoalteromonas xiamenensis]|uniref:EAL domain-containing protein n=1 Tax=Pseudoalteromonas xiamenensis TaxID=882626 RepID=UPI0035E7BBD8